MCFLHRAGVSVGSTSEANAGMVVSVPLVNCLLPKGWMGNACRDNYYLAIDDPSKEHAKPHSGCAHASFPAGWAPSQASRCP